MFFFSFFLFLVFFFYSAALHRCNRKSIQFYRTFSIIFFSFFSGSFMVLLRELWTYHLFIHFMGWRRFGCCHFFLLLFCLLNVPYFYLFFIWWLLFSLLFAIFLFFRVFELLLNIWKRYCFSYLVNSIICLFLTRYVPSKFCYR